MHVFVDWRRRLIYCAMALLLCMAPLALHVPNAFAAESTTSKLIDITTRIVMKAAKVGISEAGTRVLGSSWKYFEPVVDTLLDELKPKYEHLDALKRSDPGPDGEKLAQQVSAELANNPKIRALITDGFANLSAGQREIVNRISRLESELREQGERIQDLKSSNDKKLDYLIAKIDQLEKQKPGLNFTSGITMFDLEGAWTLIEATPKEAFCGFTQGQHGISIRAIDAFQAKANYSLLTQLQIIPSLSGTDKPVCLNPRMNVDITLYGTLLRLPLAEGWSFVREVSLSDGRMLLSWDDGSGRTLTWVFIRSH